MTAQIIPFPKRDIPLRPDEPWACDSDPILVPLVRKLTVMHELSCLRSFTRDTVEEIVRKHGLPPNEVQRFIDDESHRRRL